MIVLYILLVLFIIITLFTGNYFCNIALNPNVSKKYIIRNVTIEDQQNEIKDNIYGKQWLKEFVDEIDIVSSDNFRLHGYKVKNPIRKSDIWVILVHGYMGCSYEMVKYAEKFINLGFNALLVDLRAHGKSEGKYIGMGWKDKNDLLLWIDRICCEYKECKIILYGMSMGAATVMMVSGEKLPINVKCVVEDCGYSSVSKEFRGMLKSVNSIIAEYILFSASLVCKVKVGYGFKQASCINQIKKSKIPILFIHGNKDTFVPFEMLEEVYNAALGPKEKIIVKDAGHTKCSKVQPELYWNKVEEFIYNYI